MYTEDKQEIFEDYSKGLSTVKISKKYHTSPKKVKAILLSFGVDIHDQNRSIGPKVTKPAGYWSIKKNAEFAASQCRNRSEFNDKFSAAYVQSVKNGWLDEFSEKYFSDRPEFPSLKSKIHSVYAYEIEEAKAVYIGRTTNINRRDYQHRMGVDNDTLYRYCTENNRIMPEPKILECGLDGYESQEEEDWFVEEYRRLGWKVLNIAKTGKGIGSLGATAPKWTYEACKEAAVGCRNKEEYKKKYSRAHNVARENGWIDEFFPFSEKAKNGSLDTLDGCKEAASSFASIMQIRREYPFLYHKISRNRWTEEIRRFIGETESDRYNERITRNGKAVVSLNGEEYLPFGLMTEDEHHFFDLVNECSENKAIIDKSSEPGKVLIIRNDGKRIIVVYVTVDKFGTLYGDTKNSDISKYIEFGKHNDYRVIVVYDSEYIRKHEIVMDKIHYILNCYDGIRIYARNCTVTEITKGVATAFLDENHIQGSVSASVYIGAFYNDELIGVMTFRKGRINGNEEWDLNRFATKIGYSAIGLGGKLFKYFTEKYKPSEISSFGDLRWTDLSRNIYLNLEFEYQHITPISYAYFNRNSNKGPELFHKIMFGKNALLRKYGKTGRINKDMTEAEMTKELGFDRIWDCGLIKYVWKKKEGAS